MSVSISINLDIYIKDFNSNYWSLHTKGVYDYWSTTDSDLQSRRVIET